MAKAPTTLGYHRFSPLAVAMLFPYLPGLLASLPLLLPCPEPELAPLQWLPPANVATEQRALCREYVLFLKGQVGLYPNRWADFQEPLCYAVYCESCWEDLCFAWNVAWQTSGRLQALERLREQIGGANFNAGRLPQVSVYFTTLP